MKLYRKKLNSVEELKREYIRLNYRKKQIDAADLVPDLGFLGGNDKERGSKNSGILEMAMSLINAKGPLQMALAVAGPLLGMIGKNKKKAEPGYGPKKLLGKLLKEIVIGYVVGKGLQLAGRGLKAYLKKQRQQKSMQRAEANMKKATVR